MVNKVVYIVPISVQFPELPQHTTSLPDNNPPLPAGQCPQRCNITVYKHERAVRDRKRWDRRGLTPVCNNTTD